jgi:hypothetical protein
MIKIKNQLTGLGVFLGGIVTHHYGSKLLEYKSEMLASKEQELKELADQSNMETVNKKLDKLVQGHETLIEKVNKLLNKYVPDSDLADVGQKIEYSANQCKTVKTMLEKGPENITPDFYSKVYNASVRCYDAQLSAQEAVDKILENLNNKFVSNFDFLSDYLNSLNLLELSALFHLIVLFLISIFTINILSAVLGNEIINYLNLEKKFPKLSNFFKIRLKFQRYYLILNFSFMFIICIVAFILNILVLF